MHDFVRAQKKCPKAVPRQKHVVWSHALKCSMESYVPGSLTKMLFQWDFIHVGSLHMIKYNISTIMRFQSAMVSWFLRNSPSDHETWPIWFHVGILVESNIHLAYAYSVGPSSVVWSELGLAPPFPPMRVLEVQWSHALSLVCEVALSVTSRHLVFKCTS